jgi:hypothetical protein
MPRISEIADDQTVTRVVKRGLARGHLGEIRHRSEVVEYRVKQHKAKLGEKVRQLKLVS